MFERFQRCEATVVARHVRGSATSDEPPYDYVLDVHVLDGHVLDGHVLDGHVLDGHVLDGHVLDGHADGSPDPLAFRATINDDTVNRMDDFRRPQVGDVVGVLYDVTSRHVAFDPDDPRMSMAAGKQALSDALSAAVAGAPGAPLPPTGFGGGLYVSAAAEPETFFDGRTPDVLASMHTPPGGISADPGERLAKLQALKEDGVVSDEEYRVQRQRLIDSI